MNVSDYLKKTRAEFREAFARYSTNLSVGMPSHPGKQKGPGGMELHVLEVIEKALQLNNGLDEGQIIEACLAHDLDHWDELPLYPWQTVAILATKGMPWEIWRKKTRHFRFVVLILIADMWSAYLGKN